MGEEIKRSEVQFPRTLDELLRPKPEKPIVAVIKRGESVPSPFDRKMISSAVTKASIASGKNYSPETAEQITDEVEHELRKFRTFPTSKRTIPHVEDVQDVILGVFDERNAREISKAVSNKLGVHYEQVHPIVFDLMREDALDPTGEFYKRYREERSEVRNGVVRLPFTVEFDSTDKQLQIHSVHNGSTHKFDASLMMNYILEKTSAGYDDARAAVKRVEQFLTHRKTTRPIEKDEMIAIIDAALMERGYSPQQVISGGRLDITTDDVNQLIVSKSVENSNIKKNNPEAVNLGIAELILKQIALREVFDAVYKIENKRIYYLILKRKLHWTGWEFPKGGIEIGESPEVAVRRECYEETGNQMEGKPQ